jgi:phosphoserine phosphatase
MTEDGPIVEEVRRRAMQISERFGHDPRRYLEHLKLLQEREKDRVVGQPTVVPSKPVQ